MSSPPSDSAPDLAREAALASDLRVLLGRLRRRLREETPSDGLSWPQLVALARLEREGPASVTGLAHAEGMRPQSMGPTVAALEEAGLVLGTPDPADGRRTLYAPTDAGRERVLALRAAREDWLARTLHARLSDAEQAELARAVELLRRLADA